MAVERWADALDEVPIADELGAVLAAVVDPLIRLVRTHARDHLGHEPPAVLLLHGVDRVEVELHLIDLQRGFEALAVDHHAVVDEAISFLLTVVQSSSRDVARAQPRLVERVGAAQALVDGAAGGGARGARL